MRQADVVRRAGKGKKDRTTQIIFGERQHLLSVLDSLQQTRLPPSRLQRELRLLETLVRARTKELDRINPHWDEKVRTVSSADVKPEVLEELARKAPKEDYYLLRVISEHPKISAKTLRRLARHPYPAIRENVARHPNTDTATLERLSRDPSQPLWYLVAFNPNTPSQLRKKFQERMRKLGQRRETP
jgi:hypothetical protein